jgi:hypothetical protein
MKSKYFVRGSGVILELPEKMHDAAQNLLTHCPKGEREAAKINMGNYLTEIGLIESMSSFDFLFDCGRIWIQKVTEV